MKLSTYLYITVLMLVISLAFTINFYPLSLHPNDYILSGSGDGFKNYYGAMYQVEHSGQAIINQGMFYPWGSHMLYADVIPVYVWSMKALSSVFPGIIAYKVGVFNSLIFISYIVCALVVFLLLKRFELPDWANVLVCIPIVLLSPQIYRITGHYGLSYAYIIPLWIWLLHRYITTPKTSELIWIFASTILAIFIHPYHGFNAMIFFGFVSMVSIIRDWRKKDRTFRTLAFNAAPASAVVLAFIFFMTFMKITDPETDRVANPYGMMEYRSKMEGLFLPISGPINTWLNSIIKIAQPGFEAFAFVGTPAALFWLGLLISSLLFLFKKFKNKSLPILSFFRENTWWGTLLVSTLFIYLLAMAYPMRLKMEFLMELIPPIKQFRSLGRLSWLVHYVIVLSMVVFAWNFIKSKLSNPKSKNTTIAISIVLLGIWYFDAYQHFFNLTNGAPLQKNPFAKEFAQQNLPSIEYSRYQAILSMPTFLEGSEKMGTDKKFKGIRYSLLYSYHGHLPCIGGLLTRLPIEKGKMTWSALAHPSLYSNIWNSLPNNKPILLLVDTKAKWDGDTIAKHLTCIFKSDSLALYEMPITFMKEKHREYCKNLISDTNRTPKPLVHFDFENLHSERSFTGKGAIKTTDDSTILFRGKLPLTQPTDIEISVWHYLNYNKVGIARIPVIVYQNNTKTEYTIRPDCSFDITQDWMRYRLHLPNISKADSLLIYTRYESTWMDDLEIRAMNENSFYTIGNKQLKNNYPIQVCD